MVALYIGLRSDDFLSPDPTPADGKKRYNGFHVKAQLIIAPPKNLSILPEAYIIFVLSVDPYKPALNGLYVKGTIITVRDRCHRKRSLSCTGV